MSFHQTVSPSGGDVCYYTIKSCSLTCEPGTRPGQQVTGAICCWCEAFAVKTPSRAHPRSTDPSKKNKRKQHFFQIYLTSILCTYKVSRKLQNIYCREGIIMLRSKDKTICRTQTEQSFFSLVCSNTLLWWTWRDHICTKKSQDIILYKAPFYKGRGGKKSAHENPNVWMTQFINLYDELCQESL